MLTVFAAVPATTVGRLNRSIEPLRYLERYHHGGYVAGLSLHLMCFYMRLFLGECFETWHNLFLIQVAHGLFKHDTSNQSLNKIVLL